jgi:Tol biopolymer transport system component
VFIVNTKNHRVRRLTPWRLNSEHPAWSPDSRWILFNNAPDGTIQVIRPNGEKRLAKCSEAEQGGNSRT